MIKFRLLGFLLLGGLGLNPGQVSAGGEGDSVIVVYNQKVAESRAIADHYARRRQVPTNQVLGFDLPSTEAISRVDYQDHLERPLFELLESQGLFQLSDRILPASREHPGKVYREVVKSKIRYAVLCYGVPVRINQDTNLVEKGQDKVRVEVRRNEAAVDSELALLPLYDQKLPRFGPINNLLFGTTNTSQIHPVGGLLMVARLDGPTPAIASNLVDLALQAETNGLWGRAYFDARGLTNGEYKVGDDWIRGAAAATRRWGLEVVLDDQPATFPAETPLSQVALYTGWYDGTVSGPFGLPKVEFMPGAIGYHLHSFSGHEIRSATQYWVGPLLAKGVTATLGSVFEPYLIGTPNINIFFARLFQGASFGEAAYSCQLMLSWQTTCVGDPLYRPFARDPQVLHDDLLRRNNPLVEWSFLRLVNLNAAAGMNEEQQLEALRQLPIRAQSAVLEEKLAELYAAQNRTQEAIEAYTRARQLSNSTQQTIRLTLEIARSHARLGHKDMEYAAYQGLIKNHPAYPAALGIYEKLWELATDLGKASEAEIYQREIDRLKPSKTPTARIGQRGGDQTNRRRVRSENSGRLGNADHDARRSPPLGSAGPSGSGA